MAPFSIADSNGVPCVFCISRSAQFVCSVRLLSPFAQFVCAGPIWEQARALRKKLLLEYGVVDEGEALPALLHYDASNKARAFTLLS